jgi:hypothetical protein
MINGFGGLMSAVSRYINPQPLYGSRPAVAMPLPGQNQRLHATELYRILRAYYYSNGMYDMLRDALRRQGEWAEALKPLRNPSYRVVEFHAQHMWPGTLPDALPILADNQRIIEPIQQVWTWSNWTSTKQVAARHLALYGDKFVKVAQTVARDRVFFQLIEPEHVTDFDVDERDFITYIRIDVPIAKRLEDGTTQNVTHTEEWSKATGRFRVWEHPYASTHAVQDLGTPSRDETIESFGINFVPITHAKFADIGEKRGMGALVPALDKIDEANRQATRLNEMLFRNIGGLWALKANMMGQDGRPMPPPRIRDTDGTTDENGTITLGDDKLVKLPGMTELQSLVPNIDYDAALHVLQDHMAELEGDLPELVMYRLSEGRDLSGKAVRLLLGPAISRLEEARGNAESSLIRADQMALTMCENAGLFPNLGGTFRDGAFDHAFQQRDVLPTDAVEQGQAALASAQALQALTAAQMPIELAVQEVYGWSPERAQQFTADRLAAIQRQQALAQEDVTDGVTQ